MKRYSVLTYIFNHYDIPHQIKEKDPDAEYLCITDDPNLKSDDWTVIYDKSLDGLSPFDKCYCVRFGCFKYCNTDICLRVDGSVGINVSLKPFIDDFEEGKYDACLMIHPYRNNLIAEYMEWVKSRSYPAKQAAKCISMMDSLGYDFLYKGMFQGCFSIQRRGELTESIDKLTLYFMRSVGEEGKIERLDQTILSFVINKYFNHINVMSVTQEIFEGKYLSWYGYNSMNTIPLHRSQMIQPFMFNKPVMPKKYE